MKDFLRNLSIRNKLLVMILVVTIFSIGVGFTFYFIRNILYLKTDIMHSTLLTAKLTAGYCEAPLAFDDALGAEEALSKLDAMPSVNYACIYDPQGKVFAKFRKHECEILPPKFPKSQSYQFGENSLHVFHPILFKGRTYGMIYLCASTASLQERIREDLLTLLAVFTAIMALSYFIASRLQQIISMPIVKLTYLTYKITQTGDYSVRVRKHGEDEIGQLQESVNLMVIELERTIRSLKAEIEERTQAEQETDHLRRVLKNIIDSMPSVLVGVNIGGQVTHWNREAADVTGVSAGAAQGALLEDVFPVLSAQMENVRLALQDRQPRKVEKIQTRIRGEMRFTDLMVYPLVGNGVNGAVLRMDDVTQRVRIEEMMIQTEKMMSVGGLAAGMAHEINNPLGVILQGVQGAQRRLSPDLPKNLTVAQACGTELETIRHYLEKRSILAYLEGIREAGLRAAKIVENMLNFSRGSVSGQSPVSVKEIADRSIELAASDYDLKKKYDFKTLNIVREYDWNLPEVVLSAAEIEQVILNLLKNAAHAIAEKTYGSEVPTITIRTYSDDAFVSIEVEDNGQGMSEDVRKRVFEPFFTTKDVGLGTGLGLSVSYFIIMKNHKGKFRVESELGEGTKFIIQLPLK